MLRHVCALRSLVFFLLLGWVAAASAQGLVFHVAPSGNDAWSGKLPQPNAARTDGPLATLAGARDAIRKLRQAGPLPHARIVVELATGVYRLTQPLELDARDSGSEGAPVVYRAFKRGTALLTGSVLLGDWRPVADAEVLKRLDPKARDQVVWTSLDRSLIDELPGFANGGCGFERTKKLEYPLAVYQAGKRLPVARWPNEGFTRMGECLGSSVIAGHVGRKFTDGIFRFDNPRLARWIGEPDLWFNGLWFHPWADEKIRLKTIDPKEKSIALANGHVFGFKKGQEFYAFNAISEIDEPGEWAVDRTSRRLYLWPAADLRSMPPVLAVGDTLIKAERLAHVTFEGLVFEACRQNALNFKDCTAVIVAASTVRHTGSWAVNLDGGERGTVIGCDLYDLGEGGVNALGGNHDKLIPGRHRIENNHIHHIGRIVACYRPGASVRGVGNAIRHNLIYQTDHQAIFFDGNDHTIEYNIVHDVCLHTSDAGPLYACTRDWTKRGTVIRHNLFHAAGEGLDACGCRSIYLDDWTSGVTVTSNIVSQADCGINLGGGRDNVVTDNIALNCRQSISLHSRGVDSFARKAAEMGRNSGIFRLLMRDVYKTDLWRQHYPTLLAPLDMDPVEAHDAHGNTIRNNLSAGSGEVKISNAQRVMKTCVVANNVLVDEDPGFVDYWRLDLRLRPDAPIFKKLPGFKAPDFAKMGLYDDPRRASPAVKFGPGVTPMRAILSPEERAEAEVAELWPVEDAQSASERIAVIRTTREGGESALVSRARLVLKDDCLVIRIINDVTPNKPLSLGQVWGKDDAVEVALALARGPGRQDVGKPFVLRGYANGRLQSVIDGGVSQAEAQQLASNVEYAAQGHGIERWKTEWRIPLAALGVPLKDNHLPLLAQITVFRSADASWTSWRQPQSRDTWNVHGGHALWLVPLGNLAFLPGAKPSVSRVAVRWARDKVPMRAGKGAENPTWARPDGSRIEAHFGEVRADRWYPYEFEFTPEADGEVAIELMGTQGLPTAWTYYDAIRAEGAELVNGDFESVSANGSPQVWHMPTAKGIPPMFIRNARLAASGSRLVMASHDVRPWQMIRVKSGQKVTVRFQARAALVTGD